MTPGAAPRDWAEWHRPYDDPASLLSGRLRRVQDHLRVLLDRQPPGPVQLISLCAGQGRDVIGVLAGHQRGADVRARLVELDLRNVEYARRAAAAAGLDGVEVLAADAGLTDAYAGAVPAQIVVACGIFGNITDADIARTVFGLPGLCAPGAGVIWTRHTLPPDLTPAIRRSRTRPRPPPSRASAGTGWPGRRLPSRAASACSPSSASTPWPARRDPRRKHGRLFARRG
jgi:hypothetical protein